MIRTVLLHRARVAHTEFTLRQGDIIAKKVGVIVNAANSQVRDGGEVDGAIHCAGGLTVLKACNEIRMKQEGCPEGQTVIMTAGQWHAQHVIHAVGLIWKDGSDGERDVWPMRTGIALNEQQLATRRPLRFRQSAPGYTGFPIVTASPVALIACCDYVLKSEQFIEIRSVFFSREHLATYHTMASEFGFT